MLTKKNVLLLFSGLIILIILAWTTFYAQGTSTSPENIYDRESLQEKDYIQVNDYLSSEVMREDFIFFQETLKDVHPDPERHLGKTWEELVGAAEGRMNEPIQGGNFAVLLSEFLTLVGDAHTRFILLT